MLAAPGVQAKNILCQLNTAAPPVPSTSHPVGSIWGAARAVPALQRPRTPGIHRAQVNTWQQWAPSLLVGGMQLFRFLSPPHRALCTALRSTSAQPSWCSTVDKQPVGPAPLCCLLVFTKPVTPRCCHWHGYAGTRPAGIWKKESTLLRFGAPPTPGGVPMGCPRHQSRPPPPRATEDAGGGAAGRARPRKLLPRRRPCYHSLPGPGGHGSQVGWQARLRF
jgi:hypothetical protein